VTTGRHRVGLRLATTHSHERDPQAHFLVLKPKFYTKYLPCNHGVRLAVWFGTRRPVVRIHSPRPILSIIGLYGPLRHGFPPLMGWLYAMNGGPIIVSRHITTIVFGDVARIGPSS